ncbi:MAG: RNA-binding protein, partial [Lentisphaerae bacterium]
AEVFVRLLGEPAALGEAFHITRHLESFSWREIYLEMGRALGVEPRLVCVPSDTLVRYRSAWAGPLLGDRTWSVFFDNSKVMKITGEYRCQVSLREGMERAAAFFRRRLANYRPDMALHHFLDRIAADQERIGCDNEPGEKA